MEKDLHIRCVSHYFLLFYLLYTMLKIIYNYEKWNDKNKIDWFYKNCYMMAYK